jgi:ribosomal protein S18 acetylase RimI-like enzyme
MWNKHNVPPEEIHYEVQGGMKIMKIREGGETDFEDIAKLAFEFEDYLDELENTPESERVSRDTMREVLLEGFSDPKHFFFVAEDEGKIIGFSDFWIYPEFIHGGNSAYLNNLFITKENRRAGVGSQLLSETLKKSKEMKAVALHISVLPENVIAQNFYKKNGIDWQILMFEKKL